MSHPRAVSGSMTDSPPDIFQHTLLLFKDICPPLCLWWHDCCRPLYNAKEKIRYLCCGLTNACRTGIHSQIHVSYKCIPLLWSRLSVVIQSAHFLCMCSYVESKVVPSTIKCKLYLCIALIQQHAYFKQSR